MRELEYDGSAYKPVANLGKDGGHGLWNRLCFGRRSRRLAVRRELLIAGGLAFGIAGAMWELIIFWLAGQRKEALPLSILDHFGILAFIFPYLPARALLGAVFEVHGNGGLIFLEKISCAAFSWSSTEAL